jgi:2-amino-4-hydroxy-6-hydroxymethyldihydropteridine diphosphokinase
MDEHIVYLGLGSNLGNRLANLKAAISNLTPQMVVKKKSSVYETPPWGYEDQPAFLNQVVMVQTYEEPDRLLAHLKRIETAMGRTPTFPNGPRLIDIDILFFNTATIFKDGVVVPHPRLHERAFVLVPMNEIAPDFIHPTLSKSMRELLANCDASAIKKFTK